MERVPEKSIEAVRERDRRLHNILDSMFAFVGIYDVEGNLIHANQAPLDAAGLSLDQVIGKPFWETYWWSHSTEEQNKIRSVLTRAAAGETVRDDFSVRISEDSTITLDATFGPVFDAEGKVCELVGSGADITERLQAEEALRESEKRVHQAQKMDAVGQLAGGIAHDFNNMLQAISGYTGLALDELPDDNPARGSLEEVLDAAERSTSLVRRLLAFSRQKTEQREKLDLSETLRGLLEFLRRVIGEHVHLTMDFQQDLDVVYADPGELEQLVVNLCVNARDAMPEGGTITIQSNNVSFGETFCEDNRWARPGDFICLAIRDDGAGMTEEVQERLFEPFFTTKGVGEGTGLGLSIVYAIVHAHDGILKIESELGRGTTFRIYFPTVERDGSLAKDTSARDRAGHGSETILLAEDEDMVRNLMIHILEKAGFTVLSCRDGDEAAHVFEDRADEIDIAVLDVVMPKLGGKEVFETIRSKKPSIPVLFASGYSSDQLDEDLLDAKSVSLISKPHGAIDLLIAVRSLLDGR